MELPLSKCQQSGLARQPQGRVPALCRAAGTRIPLLLTQLPCRPGSLQPVRGGAHVPGAEHLAAAPRSTEPFSSEPQAPGSGAGRAARRRLQLQPRGPAGPRRPLSTARGRLRRGSAPLNQPRPRRRRLKPVLLPLRD